jgi:hypothetical protein
VSYAGVDGSRLFWGWFVGWRLAPSGAASARLVIGQQPSDASNRSDAEPFEGESANIQAGMVREDEVVAADFIDVSPGRDNGS